MKEIVVSVVMPAYNSEKYIGQAISSVLQQSVPLELIIVEDGGTDHTKEAVEKYLSDDRVIYVRNEQNMGVAGSRNRGIEMARGKYIAFLDSDDYWTADKLEKQLALMEGKKAVLSSTGRELMDEEGVLSGRILEIPEEITYDTLLRGNVMNTSGTMVLTSVAREFPMVQDHLHEDYIMWLSILKKYHVAYGLNEPMLKYRLMNGSKSGNKLKSAKMTFGVYRYMGLDIMKSIYYFIQYAFHGILKYSYKK